ncbi:MAG: hypothetical protein J4G18_02835, partial [Anaerolineae bacterium]|nr:hypothetical protein [Anaerolineae bacterium]
YDVTRNGARLVMRYDEANNRFVGKVANMSKATLTRVRVEIHLSNGVELGPTTPTDVPAGHLLSVTLPATDQPFDSWTPHAEVGMSEGASGKGSGDHGGRSKAAAVDPDRWRKPRTPLTLGGVLTQHFSSGALYNSCDAPEQLLV